MSIYIYSLRPSQNACHFVVDISKYIFMNVICALIVMFPRAQFTVSFHMLALCLVPNLHVYISTTQAKWVYHVIYKVFSCMRRHICFERIRLCITGCQICQINVACIHICRRIDAKSDSHQRAVISIAWHSDTPWNTYRKVSNIRRTKSQNLNASRFIL